MLISYWGFSFHYGFTQEPMYPLPTRYILLKRFTSAGWCFETAAHANLDILRGQSSSVSITHSQTVMLRSVVKRKRKTKGKKERKGYLLLIYVCCIFENTSVSLLRDFTGYFSVYQDIIWHAFGQRVQAKMIQCTLFGNPYSGMTCSCTLCDIQMIVCCLIGYSKPCFIGRALVLFRTKDAADDTMQRLTDGCLVLDSGR